MQKINLKLGIKRPHLQSTFMMMPFWPVILKGRNPLSDIREIFRRSIRFDSAISLPILRSTYHPSLTCDKQLLIDGTSNSRFYLASPTRYQNDALPAECLVLVFKPGECVLKMLRIKIWPIFIPDIEIRINRLHREKTAQSASSSPAYNQIQT